MTRRPACLHGASRRFVYLRGVDRVLHYMCKSDACTKFQEGRGLTRTQGGAYGVVGVSGVKDARKNVLIADASASADRPMPVLRVTGQTLDRYWTNTGQLLCNRAAAGLGG